MRHGTVRRSLPPRTVLHAPLRSKLLKSMMLGQVVMGLGLFLIFLSVPCPEGTAYVGQKKCAYKANMTFDQDSHPVDVSTITCVFLFWGLGMFLQSTQTLEWIKYGGNT